MKKISQIALGIILILGFLGCNNDGSNIDIDMDEFIDNPTNLRISGTNLLWDEVDNADGYIVYANGEKEDKVDGTSFDFSDLDGDVLIFQVRTRAPRGMQDSVLSASIAYVANKQAEIAAVSLAIENSGTIFVDDDFAEELVNKGITSQDINEMLVAYENYSGTVNNSSSTTNDCIDSLRELLAEMDNVEGIVSAIVKVELPSYILMEIVSIDREIANYEDYFDTTYYAQEILELEQEKDLYEDLLTEIEDNPDDIVLAVTAALEYFISIDEMLNDNFIDLVVSLTETENPDDLNVSELEAVLEETVSILRETMPSEEDVVMTMNVLVLFSEILGSESNIDSDIDNFTLKASAQAMYTLELFINFLDTFDEEFFNELETELDSNDTEDMKKTETIILVIEVFDQFYEDNESLMDTIDELFTDEEREIMYSNNISVPEISSIEEMYGLSLSNLEMMDFNTILEMEELLGESFEVLLDAMVENDCELIRQISISQGFSYYEYTNFVTGEDYNSYEEFKIARESQKFDLYKEIFIVLDKVLETYEKEDMNVILTYFTNYIYTIMSSQISMYEQSEYINFYMTEEELENIMPVIESAVEELDDDLLVYIQNLVEYIVDENVFDDLKELEVEFIEDEVSYQEEQYAMIIFFAGHYDSFMTTANENIYEDILEVVFDVLDDEDMRSITEMTSTEVDELEVRYNDILDLFNDDLTALKQYDYTDLNSSETQAIDDFLDDFYSLLYNQED